jgi:hypothetical protein
MRGFKNFSYLILLIFAFYNTQTNAQVTVSGSTGANGTYASLTQAAGAFAAINAAGSQSGNNIVITITANVTTENGANSLNSGTWTSLTITPSGARTLSGTVALPLINLNGADNVTIDGINSGGNTLTISNLSTSATAGTSAIRLIADASNNTIIDCIISGSSTGAATGVIIFSTGTTTGNDNNVISYNTIGPAGANLPTNAIYSAGTSTGVDNSSNSISYNNIQDYYNAAAASNGIFIASNSSAWTISDNKFFQTATRTCTATGFIHRAINVITASGVDYTITNNTIGYANSSGTGVTTYAGAFPNRFLAIEMTVGTSIPSDIQGNIIKALSLNHSTTATSTAPGIFCGISVLAGAVEIGSTTKNTIGDTLGTGSIAITSSITGNYIAGIYATSTNTVDIKNNLIGSIAINGAAAIGYVFHGINSAGTGGNFTISDNIIGSLTTANSITVGTNGVTTTGVCTFNGITNSSTGTTYISENIIRNGSTYGTGASIFNGITNSGSTGVLEVLGNSIISGTNTGTGAFIGISNSAAVSTLNIEYNIIRNHSRSAATGAFTALQNSGSVTTSISISFNQLGNSIGELLTYSVANSSAFIGINNTAGTGTCNLIIQSNDFRGITHSVQGTNTHTYIINSAATLSQTISSNTFTNLNVNTIGNIVFISNSVVISSTGAATISNNSIVGTFTRSAAATAGSITLFTSVATSIAGGIISISDNDFSNITISGAATMAGWVYTDAGNATINIQGNTFSNWTGGTGTITAYNVNLTNTNNALTNNNISGISCACNITGITTGAGNNKIFLNTIYNLNSTGTTAAILTGIAVTAGTNNSIYQNTIDSIQNNTLTTGSVNGITISGGTTINAHQNTISRLKANSLTTGTVNGITISSGVTVNIYKNKIYDLLSTSSAQTGTVNGIVVSGSVASLTVNIYNNLIGDLKVTTASGADLIRGISLTNTGTTSNNNVYYNTIYLNASSSGTNFGTTGIYHTANATSTTAKLDLRNNSITNYSVPNGTGNTVVLRRSSTSFANYASTSDNNLLYAGAAGTFRVIFFDGTNKDQTLSAYQSRVGGGIDAVSVTEDLITGNKFFSVLGTSSNFLHMDTSSSKSSLVKNGAAPISGYATDFDEESRNATNPDIGADEYSGVRAQALSGNYNVGTGQTYTTLTGAGGLFAAINQLGLEGNVTAFITSNTTEDGSRSLFQWVEYSGSHYTITIKPSSASIKTISGNIAEPLIKLTGCDRLIIDGRFNGSGNYLTFTNTNTTATAATFRFSSDAIKDSIINCTIEGSSTSTSIGTIIFTTGVTTGNDTICIKGCTIKAAGSNLPTNAIYSAGTSVAIDNAFISILSNNIQDYFNAAAVSNGILVSSNSSAWTISGNKFYQAATRTSTGGNVHRAIKILTASGVNYTVSNNIIGYANSSSTGETTYGGAFANIFIGIEMSVGTATASNVNGNTISAITISTTSAAAVPGIFSGISILAGAVNIGTSSGNIIGASTGNGSLLISSTTTAAVITGIYSTSVSNVFIQNNLIGAINVNGTAAIGYTFYGVYAAGAAGNYTINSNTIGSTATSNSIAVGTNGTTTTGVCTFNAIYTLNTGNKTINSNTIQNCSVYGTGSSIYYGLRNSGASGNLIIRSNSIISGTNTGSSTATAGLFTVIINSGAVVNATICSNILRNHSRPNTTGLFTGILNSGAVTTSINIDSNQLGNATGGLITYSGANTRALIGISNSGGAATANLSIQYNDIRGIVHSVNTSHAHTYFINSAATLTQNISNNTLTSLSIKTSGSVIMISNNVVMPANGVQNINYNRIVGTFANSVAGALTIFTSTSATSLNNVVVNHNNNNFSNITVTGAAAINGWVSTDIGTGGVTRSIQNNVFRNWTGGSGAITAINVNVNNTNNITAYNTISLISSAGAITGILTGLATTGNGNDNIYSNTIDSLISTGTTTSITAISLIDIGITKNIYLNTIFHLQANSLTTGSIVGIGIACGGTITVHRNKIYNLFSTSANISSGIVNGILASGAIASLSLTIRNNAIGDLRATAANASDVLRGISITSTGTTSNIYVYYNTVFLNASSSGAVFGSTGIYHTANATSTTANLDLRNNIIVNASTSNSSGISAVIRRSSNSFGNFNTSSNNNLLYGGTPSAVKVILHNGTAYQTLSDYKTIVGGVAEAASVTDDMVTTSKFLSTSGSSAYFLNIDSTKFCAAESAGANISGITTDIRDRIRQDNGSYTGTGAKPDIGAYEFEGLWQWTGASNTTWSVAGNWHTSTAPNSGISVILTTGLSNYPNITSGTIAINNLVIQTNASITISNATLTIAGTISNSGSVIATNGTVEFNGSSAQVIPASTFSSNTLKNLTINNNNGVTLGGVVSVTGILKVTTGNFISSGRLTLVSTSDATALIDGTGSGDVIGNITMQRYWDSAFGYKYFSSPFQAAKVSQLYTEIDFNDAFPRFYRYDENQTGSGWLNYLDTSQLLYPKVGYAANFGSGGNPLTISVTGEVNNGNTSITLYNNNRSTTLGFNLVGNPYPSPIDWNASSGWTKTNIDNALYYFNNGSSNPFLGSYMTYINGVSSNGIASNVIGSMQGFFVHVTNGSFPVTATLGFSNPVRINNLTAPLHKKDSIPKWPLIRIASSYVSSRKLSDPTVFYFDKAHDLSFDKNTDALKLMNTSTDYPNLYSFSTDNNRLSINSAPMLNDSMHIFKLGLQTKKFKQTQLEAIDLINLPNPYHIYLYDAKLNILQNLKVQKAYAFYSTQEIEDHRFSIIFSLKDIQYLAGRSNIFNAYNRQGQVYFLLNPLINECEITVTNMQGQTIHKQMVTGNKEVILNTNFASGLYCITASNRNVVFTKKIMIFNE